MSNLAVLQSKINPHKYNNLLLYNRNEVVIYNDNLYKSLINNNDKNPNSKYWIKLT